MIALCARPRLARWVRLRFEWRTNRFSLLLGERALELNSTARQIMPLCTGRRTVEQIICILTTGYRHRRSDAITREVLATLSVLEAHALVRCAAADRGALITGRDVRKPGVS